MQINQQHFKQKTKKDIFKSKKAWDDVLFSTTKFQSFAFKILFLCPFYEKTLVLFYDSRTTNIIKSD